MSFSPISLEPRWQIAHRILILPALGASAPGEDDLIKALAFQRIFASELFVSVDAVDRSAGEKNGPAKSAASHLVMGELMMRLGWNPRQTHLFDAEALIEARKSVEQLLISRGAADLPSSVLSDLGLIALLQPWLIYILPSGRHSETIGPLNTGVALLSAIWRRQFQVASVDAHPRLAPVPQAVSEAGRRFAAGSAPERAVSIQQLIAQGTARASEIARRNLTFIPQLSRQQPVS